jgi:hypothetical protein
VEWPGTPGQPAFLAAAAGGRDRLTGRPVVRYSAETQDYRTWGVEHIWLVEPELKQFHIYDHGSLREVDQLELPEFGFVVTAADLFQ